MVYTGCTVWQPAPQWQLRAGALASEGEACNITLPNATMALGMHAEAAVEVAKRPVTGQTQRSHGTRHWRESTVTDEMRGGRRWDGRDALLDV